MEMIHSVDEHPKSTAQATREKALKLIKDFEDYFVHNPHTGAIASRLHFSPHTTRLEAALPAIIGIVGEHLVGLKEREEERRNYGGYDSAADLREAWSIILTRFGKAYCGGDYPDKGSDFTHLGKWAKNNSWY
jgi:hypothetical protein